MTLYAKLDLICCGHWPGAQPELDALTPVQREHVIAVLRQRRGGPAFIAAYALMVLLLAFGALTFLRMIPAWLGVATRGSWAYSILNFVLTMGAVWGAAACAAWFMRRKGNLRLRETLRRWGYPVCLTCGYFLKEQDRCPECGDPQARSREPQIAISVPRTGAHRTARLHCPICRTRLSIGTVNKAIIPGQFFVARCPNPQCGIRLRTHPAAAAFYAVASLLIPVTVGLMPVVPLALLTMILVMPWYVALYEEAEPGTARGSRTGKPEAQPAAMPARKPPAAESHGRWSGMWR